MFEMRITHPRLTLGMLLVVVAEYVLVFNHVVANLP